MDSNPHIGSSFDAFLSEEGILEETSAVAVKRVLSWQMEEAMSENSLTRNQLSGRMGASRDSLDALLDPTNLTISLHTLEKAASVLGKRIDIQLI